MTRTLYLPMDSVVGQPTDFDLAADFLELSAFFAGTDTVPTSGLVNEIELGTAEDPADVDEEMYTGAEGIQTGTVKRIESRQRILKSAYPYELDSSGDMLTCALDNPSMGQAAYILSLVLYPDEAEVSKLREYFQYFATAALAAEIGGVSWSFGFPRPDHSSFLAKLTEIWRVIQDGHVSSQVGAPVHPKDDQVDVFAARPHPDRPTRLLVGCGPRSQQETMAASFQAVQTRLIELHQACREPGDGNWSGAMDEFFSLCFHPETLRQVRYLRDVLDGTHRKDDRFIAALCLGALHGESHRSPNYFSNRMPRTISTKPDYSVRWWRRKGCVPPYRDVFEILERMLAYRFYTPPAEKRGRMVQADARRAADAFPELQGCVTDVITLEQSWKGLERPGKACAPSSRSRARLIIRSGGRRLRKAEVRHELSRTLGSGLERDVRLTDPGETSPIVNTQTNAFRGTKVSPSVEHDFCFVI